MESPRFALWLVIVLVGVLALSATAQDVEVREGGIGIGPLKLVADVAPGQTWEGSFRIIGSVSERRSVFDIEVRDLAQSLIGHKESVDVGQGTRSASDWIVVEPEVSIEGREQRDVPVEISVPDDAYGVHSSFLVVNLRRDRPSGQLSATVIPTVNVEILVRVRSSGPLELGVEGIEFRGAGDQDPEFLVDIRNSGVWVSELHGDILMYPEAGGFPERVELPYRSDGRPYELYPGQKIQLRTPAPRIPPGTYRAIARLELGERRESRSEFALSVTGSASSAPSAALAEAKTEIGTDLWIEQPAYEIRLPPGAVRSVPVRVSNLGEDTIALRVVVEDARLETDGRWTYSGSPVPCPGLTVEVTPDTLVIGPNTSAAVKATIQLDRDASLSSTVTKGVRFVGRGEEAAGEWQTVHDAGALIIIESTDRGDASLEIEGLELVRSHPQSNPGSAVLTVVNLGEGIGEIRGRMMLRSEAGELIAELTIGSKNWERVMPGNRRKFRMSLPIVADGVFVVEAELEQKSAAGESLCADASFTSTETIPEGLR